MKAVDRDMFENVLALVPPRMRNMTDEEWEENDRVVAEESRQLFADTNRDSLMLERGFPARALDAAKDADETRHAIRIVAAWKPARSILVLSGQAGCGKTVAATWWGMRHRVAPTFLRASDFAAAGRYHNEQRDGWLNASALVLDDLGTEFADAKGSFVVDLDQLVDRFYGMRRPLLITTNCTATQFKQRYGERIADRIREAGEFCSIAQGSMRGVAAAQ